MSRDYHRAAFHMARRDGHSLQAVETLEDCLNAASALRVDNRIFCGIKKITRADHIGATKKNNTVSVGGCGLMKDLNGLTVEIQVLLGYRIRVAWPSRFRRRGALAIRSAHSVENGHKRYDVCACVAPAYGAAYFADVLVTAGMIRSLIGVNDIKKRFSGER